jgi:hypothetical protein
MAGFKLNALPGLVLEGSPAVRTPIVPASPTPQRLMALLKACSSVKVKRLFPAATDAIRMFAETLQSG